MLQTRSSAARSAAKSSARMEIVWGSVGIEGERADLEIGVPRSADLEIGGPGGSISSSSAASFVVADLVFYLARACWLAVISSGSKRSYMPSIAL